MSVRRSVLVLGLAVWSFVGSSAEGQEARPALVTRGRVELNLAAYNLLDEDFEVDTGTPGWGRSFKGTLKVRF